LSDSNSSFLSDWAQSFAGERSGIEILMEDLGAALAAGQQSGQEMKMLGGGNPALIPELLGWVKDRLQELTADQSSLERLIGIYDPSVGNEDFREAAAAFFARSYGWEISAKNIAVTSGGQNAFFDLFNLLGGEKQGSMRPIVFPLSPEYIGYQPQAIQRNMFRSFAGLSSEEGEDQFKYEIDFAALEQSSLQPAAYCLSRPTNPSGNVVSTAELERLYELAQNQGASLIVDNAYGLPFPNILFAEEKPFWREQGVINVYSLSKMGLPNTRTGIVIASEEIVHAITSMTAVTSLSNGTLGQMLSYPLFAEQSIADFCQEKIRPYYEQKRAHATEVLSEAFTGVEYRLHRSEGALFFWLRFENLPISTMELYEHLKKRGVLVVPGEFFFYGLEEPSPDEKRCIRINYAMEEEVVEAGLRAIGDELRSL